jgi:Protein of unknown function (DUF4238)
MGLEMGLTDHRLDMTENDFKGFLIRHIIKGLPRISEALSSKYCFLIKTTKQHPFWISDHPVVMHNDSDFGAYGNLGFEVQGIQIYFPLSPTIALVFWCPAIGDVIINGWENFKLIMQQEMMSPGNLDYSKAGISLSEFMQMGSRIEKMHYALTGKSPLEADAENVTMMNSLQVTFSHRFVFSSTEDFELLKIMLRDNLAYKHGLMPQW